MLIVNQLIPCDFSDINVSSEMSSDSSGESQDLGEVNKGLKMAYFPNVSRPQWVKQRKWVKGGGAFFHLFCWNKPKYHD